MLPDPCIRQNNHLVDCGHSCYQTPAYGRTIWLTVAIHVKNAKPLHMQNNYLVVAIHVKNARPLHMQNHHLVDCGHSCCQTPDRTIWLIVAIHVARPLHMTEQPSG